MNAIELCNITKVYTRKNLFSTVHSTGVEHLDLAIRHGEIYGLLGLNGSGKTTAIKLILGLIMPTEGTVIVQGEKVPSPAVLRQIGFLPEAPYFYRYLTAREILTMYGNLSQIDNVSESVERMLVQVGLEDAADKKLEEFSKGMLQRIGIAQSLLHNPAILVYDEPLSGLDPLAMQVMATVLLDLKRQGKTILFSSHRIAIVEKICDRVAILSRGSLVRVLEQPEWAQASGELERIFIADVAASSELGRIKLP
ncbi:MAG: ABC transporter ATP-binding protein [Elusimicrobia bacterium]|nr:ABC transporter ATP-binding protein [Elusimicrobiota bacterium]